MEIILALFLAIVIAVIISLLLRHASKLEKQLSVAQQLCEEEKTARFEAEKQLELAQQRYAEMQRRMEDWQKSREDALQHAKAAIFEVGNQLSGKLIEDHKRQTDEAKKESEEKVKQNTGQLREQMQMLEQHVASLKGKVDESAGTMDIVKRSLLSPVGAGSLAEITLENIFAASGLVKDRDFVMQYTISDNGEGNRLRPDAVVFLPAGRVMVVDSKASKFFLELAQAEEELEKQEIYGKIKATMRNHLKALAAKDYKEAVKNQLKKLDRANISHISTIMFLPSESALEKLLVADPEFHGKALEAEIIPAGPAGIVNILSIARFHIAEEHQLKNYENILEEVRKLLSSINVMYEHAERMGKAVQNAASYYDKFAASFNSRLLLRAKNIQHLGVSAQQNKPLPLPLGRYQLVAESRPDIIEGEAEETNVSMLIEARE